MSTHNEIHIVNSNGTTTGYGSTGGSGGGSDVSPEVEAMLNVYGSKNLIPYPYEQTTKTENGITFTDNGNGTVTVNGTATDTTIFTMHSSNSFILNNGTYTMDGCPNGGSTNSYYHVIQYTNSDNQSIYVYDTGDGTDFTLNGSYGRPDDASILQGIVIIAGTTVNNLTFKPMIRDARIADHTWVPFTMTNRQLTESVEELNSNKLKWINTSKTTSSNGNIDLRDVLTTSDVIVSISACYGGSATPYPVIAIPYAYANQAGVYRKYTGGCHIMSTDTGNAVSNVEINITVYYITIRA